MNTKDKKERSSFLIYLWGSLGIFLLLVFIILFAWPAASWQWRQWNARELRIRANLKQIGLALKLYALDYGHYFPDRSAHAGFNQLIINDYLTDYGVYVSNRGDGARSGLLTENTTTYAYLGSGLKDSKEPSAGEIPVAFEKPWLAWKRSAILFMDGHTEPVRHSVRFETCEKLVLHLKGARDSETWRKLLANARAVDKACGK